MATSARSIVVDCSALLPLILPDLPHAKQYAVALTRVAETGHVRLIIPQLCHLEMAAVIAKRVRGGSIAEVAAREFFEDVQNLALDTMIESYSVDELFDQAMAFGCQVADSIYVALAKDLGAELATLDTGMMQAAKQERLTLFAA